MTKRNNATNELHEEVAVMKNDINYIKKDLQALNMKIDRLIDEFPKVYATKEELKEVKTSLGKQENKLQKLAVDFTKIAVTVGFILAGLKLGGIL